MHMGPHRPETSLRASIVSPHTLDVRRVPLGPLAPDHLLVTPDAVGICATDLELLSGKMAYLSTGRAHYPIVPGHEWTGVVVELGSEVEGFSIGDRVVGECAIGCGRCERCLRGAYHLCDFRSETGIIDQSGALTEYLAFPARSAHRVPQGIEPADAALIEPLAVSLRAVLRAEAAPGARVGIIGAGTIGLLIAMVAEAVGLMPLLIEIDEQRREFARELGFETVQRLESPLSYIIEAAGTTGARKAAFAACDEGGTVVLVGLSGVSDPIVELDDVVVRDLTVKGSLGSPNVWPEVIALMVAHRLRPSSVVSNTFELEDVVQAFSAVERREDNVRKVLVLHRQTAL